ncbi:DUF1028 domain-containing protein [Jeotgalibacillus campisalis]|uniref:Putative peptidoglycan binding domain-containing protein n=1 Tax=Jeotgalibacillus campisalis TaxID=220754 RepID=A0A0C2RMH0_9BACL|nr:DUF1028 domain-containing protein [Jeotgalibacillus campisalis]KIL42954.1 hypothetical protein KR50_33570 [Jeotgalibacillus campisalis]
MTYSIVGFDPVEREWGVATQSKFLGVGAVVPYAVAGVGAIATQAYANTTYGPEGMAYMMSGKSAEETLSLLTEEDDDREYRQVGIIDSTGNAATFTGRNCYDWSGGMSGKNFAVQGNILVPGTVEAMAESFESSEGSLAERLLAALAAGQAAGGDSRGQQSAALLVVKEKGGYGGYNDRFIDLRVDDHLTPVDELHRIFKLHQLYFAPSNKDHIVPIEGEVETKLEYQLVRLGYKKEDLTLSQALKNYLNNENFEMRKQESGYIDLDVLHYMEQS